MKLSFIETTETEPSKWFQLYIEEMPTDVYWPTKGLTDYILGDLRIYNALDIEAEAYIETYDALIKVFDMFAETPGQTKFKLCFAVGRIQPRLSQKFREADALVTYHETRPAECSSSS